MGRRGAADGLAKQVQQRWNTSEVRWPEGGGQGGGGKCAARSGSDGHKFAWLLQDALLNRFAAVASGLAAAPIRRWRACTATASMQPT